MNTSQMQKIDMSNPKPINAYNRTSSDLCWPMRFANNMLPKKNTRAPATKRSNITDVLFALAKRILKCSFRLDAQGQPQLLNPTTVPIARAGRLDAAAATALPADSPPIRPAVPVMLPTMSPVTKVPAAPPDGNSNTLSFRSR
jgi:hypothetical protein